MSNILQRKFGIDVFDENEIYLNLLNDQASMALDYDVSVLTNVIATSFQVVKEHHAIVDPGRAESHSYEIKLDENTDDVFFLKLKLTKSYHQTRGEELFKNIIMDTHPRFVASFLKVFLRKFPNEGLLYGLIEIFLVGIKREVLSKDLNKLSDREISDQLYEVLPSDHILYKINHGGWVDDQGNMHEYP